MVAVTIASFAFILGLPMLEAWQRRNEMIRAIHQTGIAQQHAQQREYNRRWNDPPSIPTPILIGSETPVVDNNSEPARRDRWRSFWIACVIWSSANSGVVSWRDAERGGFETVMSRYEDWNNGLVKPFIKKSWLAPVYQGSKTKLAEGVTLSRILSCLASGDLPPCPAGEPPGLFTSREQSTVETPVNIGETV
jgi:hypothetical protein